MEVATTSVSMDIDMDMDIDIDLGPDYTELPQSDYPTILSPGAVHESSDDAQKIVGIPTEPAVLHKIHVRGVDDLTTADIRAYSTEHYASHQPLQIEWIDDSSANIVFESPEIASEALASLTLQSNGDAASLHSLQLRAAKPLPTHPDSSILVRVAIPTDRKRPRAYEASRFYMMHPEHDPREKRRRASRTDGDYHKRRYGNHEHRRRRKDDTAEGFTASMYDDDANALAAREAVSDRRGSGSSFSSGAGSSSFRGDSYRPRRNERRRSRDRSASPGKENDPRQHTRRRTPPPRYTSRDPHPFPKDNIQKELFPSKLAQTDIGTELRGNTVKSKELFPNKAAASNLKKELFPLKAGVSVHRRTDAFDAADETADLFASGMSVPFVDGANDRSSNHGRLRLSDPDPIAEDLEDLQRGGFSIRGAAKQADKGFSIRGVATGRSSGSFVKELFPGKVGNAGKEFFAERLQGRGLSRRTAADMFY